MYSFYGGREGFSFTIKKTFDSISDMVTAFRQGDGYTDVKYNEYVIINPVMEDRAAAGYIYRRGLNYSEAEDLHNETNPGGGAELVAVIPGVAKLEMTGDVVSAYYNGIDDPVVLGSALSGLLIYGKYATYADLPNRPAEGHEGWIYVVDTTPNTFYIWNLVQGQEGWVQIDPNLIQGDLPASKAVLVSSNPSSAEINALGAGGCWFVVSS